MSTQPPKPDEGPAGAPPCESCLGAGGLGVLYLHRPSIPAPQRQRPHHANTTSTPTRLPFHPRGFLSGLPTAKLVAAGPPQAATHSSRGLQGHRTEALQRDTAEFSFHAIPCELSHHICEVGRSTGLDGRRGRVSADSRRPSPSSSVPSRGSLILASQASVQRSPPAEAFLAALPSLYFQS